MSQKIPILRHKEEYHVIWFNYSCIYQMLGIMLYRYVRSPFWHGVVKRPLLLQNYALEITLTPMVPSKDLPLTASTSYWVLSYLYNFRNFKPQTFNNHIGNEKFYALQTKSSLNIKELGSIYGKTACLYFVLGKKTWFPKSL